MLMLNVDITIECRSKQLVPMQRLTIPIIITTIDYYYWRNLIFVKKEPLASV